MMSECTRVIASEAKKPTVVLVGHLLHYYNIITILYSDSWNSMSLLFWLVLSI